MAGVWLKFIIRAYHIGNMNSGHWTLLTLKLDLTTLAIENNFHDQYLCSRHFL